VVKWASGIGMQSTNTTSNLWVVNPVPFAVSIQSAIPVSMIAVENSDTSIQGINVGIRPMGFINDLESPLNVSVLDSNNKPVNVKGRLTFTPVDNGAPSALWSKDGLNTNQAPDPTKMLLSGALFGLTLSADQYIIEGNVPAFSIENLAYDWNNIKLLPYANVPVYPAAQPYNDQQKAYTIIKQSIMDSTVIVKRNTTFAALSASAILAPANPDLSVMASDTPGYAGYCQNWYISKRRCARWRKSPCNCKTRKREHK
jgi:hypothetical protein